MKYSAIAKVLLCGLCAGILGGCSYFAPRQAAEDALKEAGEKAKSQLDKVKSATIEGSELSGSDEQGRTLWKVSAKTVRALGNSTAEGMPPSAELIDAKAILYKEGKPESEFAAPRIQLHYLEDSNVRLILGGGVKAISQGEWSGKRGPVTFTTPQASINIKKRQLWTNHGVKAQQGAGTENVVVTAKTLLANTSLQTADMGGEVTSTTSRGIMSAPQAHWNWQSGQLTAKGGIKAQSNDRNDPIRFTAQQLEANASTHVATFSGKVTATSSKGTATAQKVVYHWDSGKLLASGGVQLSSKEATVSAPAVQTTREMQNATASGGVRVTRGDLRVQASTATVTKLGESAFAVTGSGTVQVHNASGSARASSATWKNGQITASGNVTMTHEGYRLSGARLVTDDKFTHATLSGGAQGNLPGGGTINAPAVTYKNGEISASGGITGRRDNLRLRADKMRSNASGTQIELEGNITLRSTDGTTATAPHARYDRKKNEIYAWGGVTLHDPAHQLTQQGKTLTADLQLKQAVLTEVSGSGKMNVLEGKKLF